MNHEPPRPTGIVQRFTLRGNLFAWNKDGAPILLNMLGDDGLYLPLFPTVALLRTFLLVKLAIPYEDIKQVADEDEFLASIPRELDGVAVHVIWNPRYVEGGKVRYLEIQRPTP